MAPKQATAHGGSATASGMLKSGKLGASRAGSIGRHNSRAELAGSHSRAGAKSRATGGSGGPSAAAGGRGASSGSHAAGNKATSSSSTSAASSARADHVYRLESAYRTKSSYNKTAPHPLFRPHARGGSTSAAGGASGVSTRVGGPPSSSGAKGAGKPLRTSASQEHVGATPTMAAQFRQQVQKVLSCKGGGGQNAASAGGAGPSPSASTTTSAAAAATRNAVATTAAAAAEDVESPTPLAFAQLPVEGAAATQPHAAAAQDGGVVPPASTLQQTLARNSDYVAKLTGASPSDGGAAAGMGGNIGSSRTAALPAAEEDHIADPLNPLNKTAASSVNNSSFTNQRLVGVDLSSTGVLMGSAPNSADNSGSANNSGAASGTNAMRNSFGDLSSIRGGTMMKSVLSQSLDFERKNSSSFLSPVQFRPPSRSGSAFASVGARPRPGGGNYGGSGGGNRLRPGAAGPPAASAAPPSFAHGAAPAATQHSAGGNTRESTTTQGNSQTPTRPQRFLPVRFANRTGGAMSGNSLRGSASLATLKNLQHAGVASGPLGGGNKRRLSGAVSATRPGRGPGAGGGQPQNFLNARAGPGGTSTTYHQQQHQVSASLDFGLTGLNKSGRAASPTAPVGSSLLNNLSVASNSLDMALSGAIGSSLAGSCKPSPLTAGGGSGFQQGFVPMAQRNIQPKVDTGLGSCSSSVGGTPSVAIDPQHAAALGFGKVQLAASGSAVPAPLTIKRPTATLASKVRREAGAASVSGVAGGSAAPGVSATGVVGGSVSHASTPSQDMLAASMKIASGAAAAAPGLVSQGVSSSPSRSSGVASGTLTLSGPLLTSGINAASAAASTAAPGAATVSSLTANLVSSMASAPSPTQLGMQQASTTHNPQQLLKQLGISSSSAANLKGSRPKSSTYGGSASASSGSSSTAAQQMLAQPAQVRTPVTHAHGWNKANANNASGGTSSSASSSQRLHPHNHSASSSNLHTSSHVRGATSASMKATGSGASSGASSSGSGSQQLRKTLGGTPSSSSVSGAPYATRPSSLFGPKAKRRPLSERSAKMLLGSHSTSASSKGAGSSSSTSAGHSHRSNFSAGAMGRVSGAGKSGNAGASQSVAGVTAGAAAARTSHEVSTRRVHQNLFDEIIRRNTTYGQLLTKIKAAYEQELDRKERHAVKVDLARQLQQAEQRNAAARHELARLEEELEQEQQKLQISQHRYEATFDNLVLLNQMQQGGNANAGGGSGSHTSLSQQLMSQHQQQLAGASTINLQNKSESLALLSSIEPSGMLDTLNSAGEAGSDGATPGLLLVDALHNVINEDQPSSFFGGGAVVGGAPAVAPPGGPPTGGGNKRGRPVARPRSVSDPAHMHGEASTNQEVVSTPGIAEENVALASTGGAAYEYAAQPAGRRETDRPSTVTGGNDRNLGSAQRHLARTSTAASNMESPIDPLNQANILSSPASDLLGSSSLLHNLGGSGRGAHLNQRQNLAQTAILSGGGGGPASLLQRSASTSALQGSFMEQGAVALPSPIEQVGGEDSLRTLSPLETPEHGGVPGAAQFGAGSRLEIVGKRLYPEEVAAGDEHMSPGSSASVESSIEGGPRFAQRVFHPRINRPANVPKLDLQNMPEEESEYEEEEEEEEDAAEDGEEVGEEDGEAGEYEYDPTNDGQGPGAGEQQCEHLRYQMQDVADEEAALAHAHYAQQQRQGYQNYQQYRIGEGGNPAEVAYTFGVDEDDVENGESEATLEVGVEDLDVDAAGDNIAGAVEILEVGDDE